MILALWILLVVLDLARPSQPALERVAADPIARWALIQ